MLINQNELEKLCKYLYPKFFDYKDISLYDLNIKIDDYLHLSANLNYYNIETKLRAIARVRVEDKIIIDINGVIKYGFINLDLNKVLNNNNRALKKVLEIYLNEKVEFKGSYNIFYIIYK